MGNEIAGKPLQLTIVRLARACSSCAIIENLVQESIRRVQRDYPQLEVNERVVDSIAEINAVEDLEVERFPAVILAGEQITAGSIVTPKELRLLVEEELSTEGV
jgi:hypothetical protein